MRSHTALCNSQLAPTILAVIVALMHIGSPAAVHAQEPAPTVQPRGKTETSHVHLSGEWPRSNGRAFLRLSGLYALPAKAPGFSLDIGLGSSFFEIALALTSQSFLMGDSSNDFRKTDFLGVGTTLRLSIPVVNFSDRHHFFVAPGATFGRAGGQFHAANDSLGDWVRAFLVQGDIVLGFQVLGRREDPGGWALGLRLGYSTLIGEKIHTTAGNRRIENKVNFTIGLEIQGTYRFCEFK